MPKLRVLGMMACLSLPLIAASCSLVPAPGRASLTPTLSFQDEPGGPVAFESGRPVPTFDPQPRLSVDLDGQWRFEAEPLDSALSVGDRSSVMPALTAELGRRAERIFDTSAWTGITVPGTFNPPPDQSTTGGYYRREFYVSPDWTGLYGTLKFGAVRYVADVWLNGTYLGYHEGGDTPFALDASKAIVPGAFNEIVVRVDNPPWGTRDDIVPWGLADWWNYGGIVGDVWLEATPALSVVRADVTPHLDGADVSIVVQNRGAQPLDGTLEVKLLPAQVNATNLLNPDASSLVPPDAQTLLDHHIDLGQVSGESVFRVAAPFSMRPADLWSPSLPALYVLEVAAGADDSAGETTVDTLFTTFGLRQIRVDTISPRLLLNGVPVVFNGVALHEERQQPERSGGPAGGPLASPAEILSILRRAIGIHADLVRADHHPPNQFLPMLADRLGLALWEEIPLYHYTPQTFGIAMDRGVPQQMLAEMDLRDFNRPSVLFHGLANESTGNAERANALDALRSLDRKIDGTRLVGQASYGIDPADPTSAGLDVVGYTMYYGVLYGGRLSGADVNAALAAAHRAYPHKPIMVMEYGRWADTASEEQDQLRVFDTYYPQLASAFDTNPGGFVGAAVWWTLDDYWTQRPGLSVETFGLYRPDGSLRKAGQAASRAFARTAPAPPPASVRSTGVAIAIEPGARHSLLLPYIGYALAVPAALLIALIVVLSRLRREPEPAT